MRELPVISHAAVVRKDIHPGRHLKRAVRDPPGDATWCKTTAKGAREAGKRRQKTLGGLGVVCKSLKQRAADHLGVDGRGSDKVCKKQQTLF